MTGTKWVLMDHDGGIDDLLSLLLVLTMPNVTLLGVTITPADCYLTYAEEASRKILDMLGQSEVPVAGGTLHGVNAFPEQWRAQPHIINALPMLLARNKVKANLVSEPAHHFLAAQLEAAAEPVTVLMTGPGSNLAAALAAKPTLQAKIAEVVWMAGAVDVTGNVRTFAHDGSAEWNLFWDPPAGRQLFEAKLPLTIFPLDATNNVPVGIDFLKKLAKQQQYPLSNFAGQCWATTINTIPHYDYVYFMWDILATSYLERPDLMTFRELELSVVDRGPNAGQVVKSPGSGQWVKVAASVDVAAFQTYLLQQFKR